MTCLEPFHPDEFVTWYRHLGRLKLFWAKPVVELLPLYKLVDGCVLKARWSVEKPKLEEVYIVILRRVKKLDFLTSMRGVKILITPQQLEKELYQLRGSIYIYSTARPCAMGIHLTSIEGHPPPGPDHVVISSGVENPTYVTYLNRWNFNIDYMWAATPHEVSKAIESAICEAQRHGGRFVTLVSDEHHLNVDITSYKPEYLYYVNKLAF
ncbi:MAG: hypothetical protein ACK4M3_06280 [Pyrobaculum sp.]